MPTQIHIRKASKGDFDSIWEIICVVIRTGATYVFSPDSTKDEMLGYWCGTDKHTYVAVLEDRIVGTFIIKDNFPGLGSHVANASYMVHPDSSGKGFGKTMGEFSLLEAKRLGYKSMQFNIVVKSNRPAIHLWQKLGFEIKGEIPDAFNNPDTGYENAYIMWRSL